MTATLLAKHRAQTGSAGASGLATPAKPDDRTARRFRRDIEGLRAIAVVLVVLFHAGVPQVTGGYVGVDVFFVISGFLITQHLLAEATAYGRIRFAHFYAARARRLLPLGSLVVVLTVAATWMLTSALETHQVAIDALWTSFFAINFYLANTGVDYQANQDPSPLNHYWSLSVEEQFYFVWPAFLALLLLVALRSGASWRVARIVTGIGVTALLCASLTYSIVEMRSAATSAYFLPTSRAWELALGGLVAIAAGWLGRQRFVNNGVVALVGVAMIGYSAFVFTESTHFPGAWAMIPAGGCALVIASGTAGPNFVERRWLSAWPMQGLGRISYGWYLWHWPLLVLGALVVGKDLTVRQGLFLVTVGLWLAICSYIAIENPLRSVPAFARSARRGLLLGGICIALSLTVSCSALVATSAVRSSGAAADSVTDASEIPTLVRTSAATGAVPVNLDPSLDDAAKDLPNLKAADGQSCHAGLEDTELSSDGTGTCVAGGTENGAKTVILTGDSHAFQWLPAMQLIAMQRNWRLINLTKAACPIYDFTLVSGQLKRDYTECYEWRTKAMERISAERPALIVTSAAIFSERDGDFAENWADGVSKTIGELRQTGAQVVELDDTPFPRHDIPKCLAKNLDAAEACDLDRGQSKGDPARRDSTTALAQQAGATTVDPFPWFCGPKDCPVIVGNTLVYRDNSHITANYAAQLAPLLGQQLPAT